MAVRSTNTMAEALLSMVQDIGVIKTMPDADLPWLIELETQIVQKIRQPIDQLQQAAQQGPGGPGGAPPNAVPGGGGPIIPGAPGGGGLGPVPPPLPQGVPGVNQGPAAPNPDEVRRIIQQG